jgi:hypothetical protein
MRTFTFDLRMALMRDGIERIVDQMSDAHTS